MGILHEVEDVLRLICGCTLQGGRRFDGTQTIYDELMRKNGYELMGKDGHELMRKFCHLLMMKDGHELRIAFVFRTDGQREKGLAEVNMAEGGFFFF